MRSRVPLAVAVLITISTIPSCFAAGVDDKPMDMQSIEALEARATAAQPREQCFLYAELVHQMTEVSVRQYASGDVEHATGLLKRIQQLAQKIHLSMGGNDKRMKDAEILLRHTSFRLNEMLHGSSFDDRAVVEAALSDVNQAQSEAMMAVFKK